MQLPIGNAPRLHAPIGTGANDEARIPRHCECCRSLARRDDLAELFAIGDAPDFDLCLTAVASSGGGEQVAVIREGKRLRMADVKRLLDAVVAVSAVMNSALVSRHSRVSLVRGLGNQTFRKDCGLRFDQPADEEGGCCRGMGEKRIGFHIFYRGCVGLQLKKPESGARITQLREIC